MRSSLNIKTSSSFVMSLYKTLSVTFGQETRRTTYHVSTHYYIGRDLFTIIPWHHRSSRYNKVMFVQHLSDCNTHYYHNDGKSFTLYTSIDQYCINFLLLYFFTEDLELYLFNMDLWCFLIVYLTDLFVYGYEEEMVIKFRSGHSVIRSLSGCTKIMYKLVSQLYVSLGRSL